MLADAPGPSMTEPNRFIRKRPGTSRSATSSYQVDVAGSTPVFRSKLSAAYRR
jgi:hypothetical protein